MSDSLDNASFDPRAIEALLHDVPLEVTVELGRSRMNLSELAAHLGPAGLVRAADLLGAEGGAATQAEEPVEPPVDLDVDAVVVHAHRDAHDGTLRRRGQPAAGSMVG